MVLASFGYLLWAVYAPLFLLLACAWVFRRYLTLTRILCICWLIICLLLVVCEVGCNSIVPVRRVRWFSVLLQSLLPILLPAIVIIVTAKKKHGWLHGLATILWLVPPSVLLSEWIFNYFGFISRYQVIW